MIEETKFRLHTKSNLSLLCTVIMPEKEKNAVYVNDLVWRKTS